MEIHAVVNSKDSASGPDGIPYAYSRVLPTETADTLLGLLEDCQTGVLPPALQALVFIPKVDFGCKADNYRPLDMPDCLRKWKHCVWHQGVDH